MKQTIYLSLFIFLTIFFQNCTQEDISSSTQVGSYSTMLTIGQKLYLVNDSQIKTFDVTDSKNPVLLNTTDLGDEIESLYHYDGLLLVGSATDMYILEINDKGIPEQKSRTFYNNVEFCSNDPIVARNDIAYVTLSSVDIPVCDRPVLDELRVYDIQNIERPELLESIDMTKPKGLGFGKKYLFVCDQEDGLVIFNIEDPKSPILSSTLDGFSAFDVIIRNNILIVACANELRQYDISDEDNIKFLGTIQI